MSNVTLVFSLKFEYNFIQDHSGDVGLLMAAWTGARKGVKGVPGRSGRRGVPGIPGEPGDCTLIWYNLATKERVDFEITYKNKYAFSFMGMQCDLMEGTFVKHKSESNTVLKMCVSLAASVLYLLVQPAPEDIRLARNKWLLGQRKGVKPPYLDNDDALAFKLAGNFFSNLSKIS